MPELPEVETVIRDLKEKVLGRTFLDLWTDTEKIIKVPLDIREFKKEITGKKITEIRRRGKNILLELSGDQILLVHQKMTGHLLYGVWKLKDGSWISEDKFLSEPVNGFIRVIFFLDNGKMLALSDMRKFAKVELWPKRDFEQKSGIAKLGPEPLSGEFILDGFAELVLTKTRSIKQVLMDQAVVAGIGNIYADEILWLAKIHPLRKSNSLTKQELTTIYESIIAVLTKAVRLRGTSIADFRDLAGKRGFYGQTRMAYQRNKEKCQRCATLIQKIRVGQRGTCFCPQCQKLK